MSSILKSEQEIKAQFNKDTGRSSDALTSNYNNISEFDIDKSDMIIDKQFYEYLVDIITNK